MIRNTHPVHLRELMFGVIFRNGRGTCRSCVSDSPQREKWLRRDCSENCSCICLAIAKAERLHNLLIPRCLHAESRGANIPGLRFFKPACFAPGNDDAGLRHAISNFFE
jgi:hypothetical protein